MKKIKKRTKDILSMLTVIFMSLCVFFVPVMADVLADEVIVGKDGWLFYNAEDSVADYEGTDLFSDF